MIIFWYGITLIFISTIIALTYLRNRDKGHRDYGITDTTIPDYTTCMNTRTRTIKGRALSLRTYPIKNCKPTSQECGCRTSDYENAISPLFIPRS